MASTTGHDLWAWGTESNRRASLFASRTGTTVLTTSTSVPSSTLSAVAATLIPITKPAKKKPLWAIPVAICLALLVALLVALFVLWKKGKLQKLKSKGWNPYVRNMKKEAQLQRVAEVEEQRRKAGVGARHDLTLDERTG